jgi:phage antirepressor YoqD-like protein
MMNLPVSYKDNVAVMSSVDLAKLCVGTSKDAHSDFMKKARKVLGNGVGNFSETIEIKGLGGVVTGKREILLLPEREACLMAMSYSYELQAWVYDEWQKEKNKRVKPALPDFANPVEAARAWADEVEKKQIAQQKLAIAAPKAEVFDKVMERDNLLNATQVAQQVGMSAIKMNRKLDEIGGVYNKCVKRGRAFCHGWVLDGYGEMKIGESGYPQALFTPKGSLRVVEIFTSEGVI